jgi:hypothetical protein
MPVVFTLLFKTTKIHPMHPAAAFNNRLATPGPKQPVHEIPVGCPFRFQHSNGPSPSKPNSEKMNIRLSHAGGVWE